jgi:hypothetical protein
MKTLEKLYEEIQADSGLKKEYKKATGDKKIIDFLKAHDCDATETELDAFISSKKNKELDDDELDVVSGGAACTTYNDNGCPIVSGLNVCEHHEWMRDVNPLASKHCYSCKYSIDEGGLLICHCPQRQEDVDDI